MSALNRIILINTHLPGVVELALNGHTNICGTNASGKTTLQRLVPVFYGEYPSRVVPSTRDSFEKWYLPREDSYIIYEYSRMDGEMCQAVLMAASDRNGVRYRFVGKPFELDDYLLNRDGDKLTFLTSETFWRKIKERNIAVTRFLNTVEFRGVIQNDRMVLNGRANPAELRSLAAQYSLCNREHALRHIEKLARAVHSKEGKMETIKSMIAAILEEDGVREPSKKLKPQQVENWIRESQLIQGFESIRPEFESLEQQYEQLLSGESRLAGLKRGFEADSDTQQQRLDESKAQIEQLGFDRNRLEEQWKTERDELQLAVSKAEAELKSCEEVLDQIEDAYQSWQEKDIEQVRNDLERLPAWRDDLSNLEQRHKLLTEQHKDVEAAYNERRSKIEQQRSRALTSLNEQKDAFQAEREQKRDQQHEELAELDRGFVQRRQQELERFKEREYQFKLSQGELKAQIAGVTYTEAEKQSLATFDSRIAESELQRETTETNVERLEQQERIARREQDTANDALTQASRRVSERDQQLQALKQMLYPGHHTLLEFLRKESSGWEASLGKVIRPELLQRSDLKPTLSSDQADSLYGVLLDLGALETPDYARSEQELRERLEQAELSLTEAQNMQQQAESELLERSRQLDQVKRQLTLARTELRNRRDDTKRLWEEKRAEQHRIDAALSERKLKAREQLKQLDHQLGQLANERDNWLDELADQQREASMEKHAYWDEVIGAIDSRIQQLKDEINERQEKAQQELKACSNWYKNELKSRGVDEKEIVKLKQQISTLEQTIADTEKRRDDVVNYDAWYQSQWLQRKPRLQAAFNQQQSCKSELEQKLGAATTAFKNARATMESQLKQARHNREDADELLQKLKALLRRLSELALPKRADDVPGELSERLNLGEQLLHSREQLLVAVKDAVDGFDRRITNQYGSSLAEFWERSREECILINDNGSRSLDYLKLVPKLSQLVNELIPQAVTGVKQQGRMLGLDLKNYYDVLETINNRIASQSARITREVDDELFLDGVSDSAVKISSRVTDLEFWDDLQTFVKAYREWEGDDFSVLPDKEYAESMRRAMEIIGRSALSGGISSLLGIELRLREGNSDLVIRTDRQLNESSSHGMAYLILCKFLLAFTRLLRGKAPTVVHWPIDELGTLAHNNIKKIFDACGNNSISVLGAFPNPDAEVLSLFANRYIIDKYKKKLQVVKPKLDPIAERIKQKRLQEAL